MFDLIAGGPRHPFHHRTLTPQFVSIAGHGLVMAAVVVWPLVIATNQLPKMPAMSAFVADVAPPPAPAPPPPPAPAAKAAPVTPQAPHTPGALVAPLAAPAEIMPETSSPSGEGEGVFGGVEGGVVGGVVGGIVGGLIAAAPPPPPPPLPPPQPGVPVRIGGNIEAPALVKRVEPIYPDLAMVAKITGIVILEASVSADGAVEQVKVLRSVKFLDQAAVEAVRQWRYSPLVLNGVRTPFVLSVTLSFSIKER
jgi:protein TonB